MVVSVHCIAFSSIFTFLTIMNQSEEIDQPYKGQKFTSFEHLKKYLEEYGQRNYVKFWIRSSHTRNSQKSKISKTMNPDLKYVSVKFACIFGGEKIRCRGSGIRKSSTYRNLGCPCMINAVVGEDGNHVKLDTVILEHNHALCKTFYDSLKKTKRKNQLMKSDKELNTSDMTISENIISENYLSDVENFALKKDWLSTNENILNNFKDITSNSETLTNDNCLKDIEDKYGKIVKILVINSETKNNQMKDLERESVETWSCDAGDEGNEMPEICRLCLSSKDKLSPIFNPSLPLESTVLSFKIMGCASIEISCDDGLPNNICTTCEANLNLAYNFRITCEKSDSILRDTYERSKIFSKRKDLEKSKEEENSSEETLIVYPEEVEVEVEGGRGGGEVEGEGGGGGEEAEDVTKSFQLNQVPTEEPLYFHFAITCPVCGTDFQSYESMLDHLGTHTDDETFLLACNICTLVCPSVTDLQEHMREHLKAAESEMSLPTAEELRSHESCHAEEPEAQMKRQTTEVKYLCNVCGKIFKTKDRFQAHRNMHEGLRPHVCLQCGRGFADRKNLHQHYDVVHLRKVRHECPVCQRKFYTRTKMKSHMTMHSGDKPFTCDVCNKTFRLKMNMNKHKKTHTNVRPYQCDKCSAAFIEKNLLKRHSYKHGGVRPFRCPVCGHGFSAKFCLKKHLKDSKCRGLVIADPDNYQWVGVGETEANLDDGKCIVVYKTDEGDALQGETETIDLNVLQ